MVLIYYKSLTRTDLLFTIISGSKLIVNEFASFGLSVHLGTRSKNESSKTEAMFIPPRNSNVTDTFTRETGDYDVSEDRFISFCDNFKYLGSFFTPPLKEDFDINVRANKARAAPKRS